MSDTLAHKRQVDMKVMDLVTGEIFSHSVVIENSRIEPLPTEMFMLEHVGERPKREERK